MIRLIAAFLLMTVSAVAQTTQVIDLGKQIARNTDNIPNYERALRDELGAFGPPRSDGFILIGTTTPECIPIPVAGTYAITARALWHPKGTVGGPVGDVASRQARLWWYGSRSISTRRFAIRVLRSRVWWTLEKDTDTVNDERLQQTVTVVEALESGDCIGTYASFESHDRRVTGILFNGLSLLVVKQ